MRIFIALAMTMATLCAKAQQISVPEPEFNNSYCMLTSDSTYAVLPKENGSMQKHQNKVSRWSNIIGGAADIASAAGGVIASISGSLGGVIAGARTMGTAASVSSAAGSVNGLTNSNGMDIVFDGGHSSYVVPTAGSDVRILVKAENNDQDPQELFRIVRFNGSKKERRIQWLNFQPALLGNDKTEKQGYVGFTGHKYGEQSYLLSLLAKDMVKGEYGIFYLSLATATEVPVGTFSIK